MKLVDFKGLFKKSTATVLSVENPFGDYYTVKLKAESGMTWRPGEHGIFTLPDSEVKGKKWRVFSVASIPQEGHLLIGTRTGAQVSSFKEHLLHMEAGGRVNLVGPFGWFTLQDDTSPLVMIATGVGITPARALLKALEKVETRPVELIYASNDYHLFGPELVEMADVNSLMTLHLCEHREDAIHLVEAAAARYGNQAYYYVSGKPDVVSSFRKVLQAKSIKGRRIIRDWFLGY